jgi:hypothetical protein
LKKLKNNGIQEKIISLETLDSLLLILNNYEPTLIRITNKNKITKFTNNMTQLINLMKNKIIEKIIFKYVNVQKYPVEISNLSWKNPMVRIIY